MLVRSLKRTMGFQFGSTLHIVRHDHHQITLPEGLREDPAFQFALKHGEVVIIEAVAVSQPESENEETDSEQSVADEVEAQPETTETETVPEPVSGRRNRGRRN